MKKSLRKLASFFVISLFISTIISLCLPYHWGNEYFHPKIEYLEKHRDKKFNTFFFGTSRVYRQIDPFIFDSIVNQSQKKKSTSFNLGAAGLKNPESFYLIENFLSSDIVKNTKYCFLELRNVDVTGEKRLHKQANNYCKNLRDILFVWKSNYHMKIGIDKQRSSISNYAVSYIENILHFGHFGEQLLDDYYYFDNLGEKENGYLSIDDEFKMLNNKTKTFDNFQEKRRGFLNDTTILSKYKKKTLNWNKDKDETYDKVYLDRLLTLRNHCKKHNITLIFILAQQSDKKTVELSKQLPKESVIDLCDPNKHSAFYSVENHFDKGHLNKKGATLYSKALANAFIKILEEKE